VVAVAPDQTSVLDEPLICDFCGFEIEEVDQECPARDEGVCAP
jgi:hypothetical protein